MLTWTITRGHDSEVTVVKFGWRGRSIALRPFEREDVEQEGLLKHGDWLMDGRWLAFYRSRDSHPNAYEHSTSVGLALGQRVWELSWAWPNPDRKSANGEGDEFLAYLAHCEVAVKTAHERVERIGKG